MNSKPVVALPAVIDDLRAAITHYSTWRTDGAEHILQKYDETIRWIAWNPDAFPKKFGSVQRAFLKQSSTWFILFRNPTAASSSQSSMDAANPQRSASS